MSSELTTAEQLFLIFLIFDFFEKTLKTGIYCLQTECKQNQNIFCLLLKKGDKNTSLPLKFIILKKN
jgi:hypothetical protein